MAPPFIPFDAEPHGHWPLINDDGGLALLLIDFQRDFLSPDGYFAAAGYDVAEAQKVAATVRPLLLAARRAGVPVFHTREGHRASLRDLPRYKRLRSAEAGAAVGAPSPLGGGFLTRGSPGWEIVPELAPTPDEEIFDKPGYGAFTATDLDHCLRCVGVRKLIVAGLTAEVCVSSTVREATDRGYECVVMRDGVAATDPRNLGGALGALTCEGGIFGSVADVRVAIEAPERLAGERETRETRE